MLAAVAADPGAGLYQAQILDQAEREQLITGWNDTAAAVPEVTLPQLFGAQAARVPDAVAVMAGGAAVSYAELEARAGRLARYLRGWGRGRRRWWRWRWNAPRSWSQRCWGCGRRGRPTCRLTRATRPVRIAFMLADAAPVVVVTVAGLAGLVPDGVRLVVADDPVTAGELAGWTPGCWLRASGGRL